MRKVCAHCNRTYDSAERCSCRPANRYTPRPGSRSVYGSKRWTELSRQVRREQPVCAVTGCEKPSEHAGHIHPFTDKTDPLAWDRANLVALCAYHNGSEAGTRNQKRHTGYTQSKSGVYPGGTIPESPTWGMVA